MRYLLHITAAFLAASTAAQADESWTTPFGDVTYLADKGNVAIFEDANFDETARIYFPGLAGNYTNRDVHDGYWIQADGGDACGGALVGADGYTGRDWGAARIIFHSPGFPSNWTLLKGSCFEPPLEPLLGTARR